MQAEASPQATRGRSLASPARGTSGLVATTRRSWRGRRAPPRQRARQGSRPPPLGGAAAVPRIAARACSWLDRSREPQPFPLPHSRSSSAEGMSSPALTTRLAAEPQTVLRPTTPGRRPGRVKETNSTEGSAMAAIQIQGLSKRFGDITAVDALSFSTREGAVTGFLGPNGAGKTTTLRMLLGLVTPTEGTATVDSRPYAELAETARHTGAVLESTGFHPGRRARPHLRVLATAAGLPLARVEEVPAAGRL